MSDFSDTPTAEGATNVSLHQRAATSPFAREVVNIQGDENPRRAIGFSATGILTALEIDENPFAVVDTEAQFDAALAAGRSIVLRGEGSEGVVALTTPKVIRTHNTTIKGPAICQFTIPQDSNPNVHARGITVCANDVTLCQFELTATQPVATTTCYGICPNEEAGDYGHRLTLADLHIHNWQRCISKDGGIGSRVIEDMDVQRVYCHTFSDFGVHLSFGFRRLRVRDSRILGRIGSESHVTQNAFFGGSDWFDCLLENCYFGNVTRHGAECTLADFDDYVHQRTRVVRCVAENCGGMGFSMMFGDGILYDHCVSKNNHWIGFEMGGTPPGEYPSYFMGTGLIDGCLVDGITHTSVSYGISLDGARDSLIRNCKILNVTSSAPGSACGIGMTECVQCSIKDTELTNVGIYATKGNFLPVDSGYHEIVGNLFRNVSGSPTLRAVNIDHQNAVVRHNTVYQAPGTTFNYIASTSAGAQVNVDGTPVAYGTDVPFTGTNLILTGFAG